MTVRGPVTWLFATWLVATWLVAGTAAAEPTRDYVVKDGDTCLGIVNRELGDPKLIDALHRLNPGLGKSPHVLQRGQILRLPVVIQTPDASLATRRGQVEVLQPGNADWLAGAEGQDLYRSWRVGTRARSSAKIRFVDDSTIDMREDSVVVIVGSSAAARRVSRTSLERGVLRAQLARLDGKPRVAVETPAGSAVLTYGAAVIDVAVGGETRLANHTGAAARLAGKVGRPVAVKSGFGSRVAPGKAPEPPTPLPPPPAWVEPEGLMLGWSDQPIPVRGEWTAVAGASKYRLEIVRANAPDAIEAQLEVPATIQRLDASNLPAGEYELRIATVDAKGLEGVASPPRRVRVVELARPRVAITGAELAVPPGLRCAAGRTAPEAPAAGLALVREADGRARISCAWGTATATLELELRAAAVKPAKAVPRVRAGETSALELVVDGVAPGAIRAVGRGGIEVVSVERTARGVRLAMRGVRAAPDAGVSVEVAAGASVVPIATIGVKVSPGRGYAYRRTLVTAAGWFGVTGGRRDGDDILYGADLAVDLTPWIAPHLAIWQVQGNGFRPGALLGATFKVGGTMRPLLRAGASFEDGRFGGHAGLGFEIELKRWLSLRTALDGIVDSSDARLHVGVGVVVHP
jgi:hypothetical protein